MMKQQLETTRANLKLPSIKEIFKVLTKKELVENVILLLLSRICFMEYLISPFGIALFSVLFYKRKRPSYVVFLILGTLLTGTPIFYFKYIGTSLIVMALLIIFAQELKHRQNTVAVLSTAALLLNGGVYVFVEGLFLYDILLLILECGLCYLSFFVFDKAVGCISTFTKRKVYEPQEIVSQVLLLACVVLSISLTENLLPLAHIISITAILFLSLTCGFSVSTPAGAVLGLSIGLVTAFPAQAVCSYTLSSLFSGLTARYGRLSVSGVFAFCTFIVTMLLSPEANNFVTVSYVAVSCLLLFFVPERLILSFGTAATNPQNSPRKESRIKEEVARSFNRAIDTIDSVSDMFEDIIKEGTEIDISGHNTVFNNTKEAVCDSCSLCRFCWQKDKQKTMSLLDNLLSVMERKSIIRKSDIPKDFSDMCIRSDSFIAELNKNYESHKVTKMWSGKVTESKRLVGEQFKNISAILGNIQENLLEKTDFSRKTEARVISALDKVGISSSDVRTYSSNGIVTEIINPDFYINSKADTKISEELTEIFEVPMVLKESTPQKLVYCQKTEFVPYISVASVPRKNSSFCGDNCTYFPFGTGCLAIVLSDGMGSGEAAAFQSNVVTTLAKKLLTSGFNTETCVRLINNILMTNADRETFATVDLCVINLYSGIAEFVKTGAASSYIKQQTDKVCVSSTSLPAGLMSTTSADFSVKYLQADDIIIMASDGVTDTLDRPDKNEIFELCKNTRNTDELCQKIIERALTLSGGIATDDMTVCVCKIAKNL